MAKNEGPQQKYQRSATDLDIHPLIWNMLRYTEILAPDPKDLRINVSSGECKTMARNLAQTHCLNGSPTNLINVN